MLTSLFLSLREKSNWFRIYKEQCIIYINAKTYFHMLTLQIILNHSLLFFNIYFAIFSLFFLFNFMTCLISFYSPWACGKQMVVLTALQKRSIVLKAHSSRHWCGLCYKRELSETKACWVWSGTRAEFSFSMLQTRASQAAGNNAHRPAKSKQEFLVLLLLETLCSKCNVHLRKAGWMAKFYLPVSGHTSSC